MSADRRVAVRVLLRARIALVLAAAIGLVAFLWPFVVAPGTYLVAATRGTLSARERITVTPGEAVKRSLPLVAARMVISARFGAARSADLATGVSGDTAGDSSGAR